MGLVGSGRTPESLAKEFEPPASSISKWVKQADLDEGNRNDGLTTFERQELRQARREIKRLRMERDNLKKPQLGLPGRATRSPKRMGLFEREAGRIWLVFLSPRSAVRIPPLLLSLLGGRSGGGAAVVADEDLPKDVECALEASHAFFEPAHAVLDISEAGIHVAAEFRETGIHVAAEIPDIGIHMVSEIREFAAQPFDVLAGEAVQVEHDADDDGRGNPLEKFKGHLFLPELELYRFPSRRGTSSVFRRPDNGVREGAQRR